MAMFMRAEEGKFDILIPDAQDMNATRKAYAKIANVIALVQYLEAERMIYLMPGSEKSTYLYYEDQTRLIRQNPMFWEYRENGKIQIGNDANPPRLSKNDKYILYSIIRNPALFGTISNNGCCHISNNPTI